MSSWVAFLRGMNVGGHRITNAELETLFGDLGFGDPVGYQASGNVIFHSDDEPAEHDIEQALDTGLGYAVPTFIRSIDAVVALADLAVFNAAEIEASTAAPQIGFLKTPADDTPPGTDFDLLEVRGTELHWLPINGVGRTELDLDAVERSLGPMTVRSVNTIRRIAKKFG